MIRAAPFMGVTFGTLVSGAVRMAMSRRADAPRPGSSRFCPVIYRVDDWHFFHVMAGLVPAIHVFGAASKVVDGRHKTGHDETRLAAHGT